MEEIKTEEIGIVIPYYKSVLSDKEKMAFQQCRRILGRYAIILVVPDSMREGHYPCDEKLIIERVPGSWMKSIAAYNEMMMKEAFYERFSSYRYILIYQFDSFVFSDKLLDFCQYGYDYIGSPWISGYFHYISPRKCVWKVGNGGLSLRKVNSFLALLKLGKQKSYEGNEDVFFSISDNEAFHVAPLEVALKFAFEREVERCYQLNNQELPFGCHAWERYNPEFWKPLIEAFGYAVGMVGSSEDKELEGVYDKARKTTQFWKTILEGDRLITAVHKLCRTKRAGYIIWGTGYYGKMVSDIFAEKKLPVKFMIDNNLAAGSMLNGVMVKKYSDCDITENDVIIVAVKNSQEIVHQLQTDHYVYLKNYFLLNDLKEALGMP